MMRFENPDMTSDELDAMMHKLANPDQVEAIDSSTNTDSTSGGSPFAAIGCGAVVSDQNVGNGSNITNQLSGNGTALSGGDSKIANDGSEVKNDPTLYKDPK